MQSLKLDYLNTTSDPNSLPEVLEMFFSALFHSLFIYIFFSVDRFASPSAQV